MWLSDELKPLWPLQWLTVKGPVLGNWCREKWKGMLKQAQGNWPFCLDAKNYNSMESELGVITLKKKVSLPANNGGWQVQHMKDSRVSGNEHFPTLEMDRDLSENIAKPLQLGTGWGRRGQRRCTLHGPPKTTSAQQPASVPFPWEGPEPRCMVGSYQPFPFHPRSHPQFSLPSEEHRAQHMQGRAKAFPSANFVQIPSYKSKPTFLHFKSPTCKCN